MLEVELVNRFAWWWHLTTEALVGLIYTCLTGINACLADCIITVTKEAVDAFLYTGETVQEREF